jgi:adenylosuccinate synthase
MINAPDLAVVTKVDVLDTFAEIPFCTEYKYKGSVLTEFPAESDVLAEIEPVYRQLPGWQASTAGIREWKQLPVKAQDYLKFLSDYLECPIGMVSTGPGRDETIRLRDV